ncbi:MAG: hypothetical protein O3A46_00675 [Candidatus Poribacteria bacterium]|nr:hypothetical protein [Candidatus Poribacteria bacterium]
MIESRDQFRLALEQLERVYRILLSCKEEYLPDNPRWFAIEAEGAVDAIDSLRAELNEFTGYEEAVRLLGEAVEHESKSLVFDTNVFIGRVCEIDLDEGTFVLREVDEIGEVRFQFDEAAREIARNALGERVEVTVVSHSTDGSPFVASRVRQLEHVK